MKFIVHIFQNLKLGLILSFQVPILLKQMEKIIQLEMKQKKEPIQILIMGLMILILKIMVQVNFHSRIIVRPSVLKKKRLIMNHLTLYWCLGKSKIYRVQSIQLKERILLKINNKPFRVKKLETLELESLAQNLVLSTWTTIKPVQSQTYLPWMMNLIKMWLRVLKKEAIKLEMISTSLQKI